MFISNLNYSHKWQSNYKQRLSYYKYSYDFKSIGSLQIYLYFRTVITSAQVFFVSSIF